MCVGMVWYGTVRYRTYVRTNVRLYVCMYVSNVTYVLLCYVTLYYVMLRYVMLRYVTLCYVM